jgi:hypothetical protein
MPFLNKDDIKAVRRRRRGVFVHTLRKPTATPTTGFTDARLKDEHVFLSFPVIRNNYLLKEGQNGD